MYGEPVALIDFLSLKTHS